jgi:phosphohistidine phosphatase
MELILWRHADAAAGIPDIERELTKKGKKQARSMANFLRKHLAADTRILVSPATRTQQTVHALTKTYEVVDAIAPGASPQSLLQAANWPDEMGMVLLVGHQPTLGQTAALLLTGKPADWSVKKGALWWLSCRGQAEQIEASLRMVLAPELLP